MSYGVYSLPINSTLPETQFDLCWMNAIASSGAYWSRLVGCALVLYCYATSQRKSLWNVLAVHAVTGFLATLVESGWVAAGNCGAFAPAQPSSLHVALLVNELFWIPNELSVVMYSYIKTRIVLRDRRVERGATWFLYILGVVYAIGRVNIGRMRMNKGLLFDADIASGYNYVYILWAVADLVLMVLLAMNVVSHVHESQELGRVLSLLNIVVASGRVSAQTQLTVSSYTMFAVATIGAYPMLLLVDVLMTRFLLYAPKTDSSGATSGVTGGGAGLTGTGNGAGGGGGAFRGLTTAPQRSGGGGGGDMYALKQVSTTAGGTVGGTMRGGSPPLNGGGDGGSPGSEASTLSTVSPGAAVPGGTLHAFRSVGFAEQASPRAGGDSASVLKY
ncbi:hypothetical protein HK405_006221 [Cladochytrium tenue]|nr:hypothetical protein HK405_006221 [Cladochytrium tenue]